nr:hypothetical protein [Mycobacterium uberis]
MPGMSGASSSFGGKRAEQTYQCRGAVDDIVPYLVAVAGVSGHCQVLQSGAWLPRIGENAHLR